MKIKQRAVSDTRILTIIPQNRRREGNGMFMKKLALILVCFCTLLALTACGKKCENGCGKNADPECMADMCDACCDYYMGLNGCYSRHYDSKWD